LKREREERDRARVKAEKTIEVVPERPSWEPKITDSHAPVTVYYAGGAKLRETKRLSSNAVEVTA
jgi:hypothetical protein